MSCPNEYARGRKIQMSVSSVCGFCKQCSWMILDVEPQFCSLFRKASMFGSINLRRFLYGARGVACVSLNMEMSQFPLLLKYVNKADVWVYCCRPHTVFFNLSVPCAASSSARSLTFSCPCLFLEARRPWLLWSVVNSAAENKGSDCMKPQDENLFHWETPLKSFGMFWWKRTKSVLH